MSYPESLLALIKKVEETRNSRLTEKFPRPTPDDKDKLLKEFHPDYNPKGKRPVKVGPSQGDQMPNELVDLLEAYPIIEPEKFNLEQIDYDVDILVIGGGGAGSSAALFAQEKGANVLLVTKLRLGDANTMMAQGGIQAADKPNDSPAIHYLDVIGGGHFDNIPELIKALVLDAPKIIKWHEEIGVMYDKEPDGTMITIHGGGTSRKRMHAARDYTGAEIMKTLKDEVQNRNIPILEFSPVVELLLDEDGKCGGAIIFNLDTREYFTIKAKATIIATGGFGRLHIQGFPTTNHYGATADGLVLSYRAGAKLLYMDAVQYHPTGAAFPEQIVGLLITEKVRGLGAHLVNQLGKQFIYPLETRDVVASGIIREVTGRNLGIETPSGMKGVWLDSPMIEIINGLGTIKRMLPAMFRQFERFDIDMTKTPILTYPTLHYQNGGVVINEWCETTVPGLFVAGETSGGVHGTNRLMGNSLLDVNVFGRRAGIRAAEYVKTKSIAKLTLKHVEKYVDMLKAAGLEKKLTAPMLLPDYRQPETLKRQEGTYGLGME